MAKNGVVIGAALLAMLAGTAYAQPRVAIVSASATAASTAQLNNQDVQSKLIATGLFQTVDIIDVAVHAAHTPTLTELQQYDAVLTWSNGTYADEHALGDVLADYVDAGGGVIVAVFATSTTTTGRSLGGRWMNTYEIIQARSGNQSGAATLGTVVDPTHPIMDGVVTFDGGTSSFRSSTFNLHPHGIVVAEWSDGRPLIAVSNQFPTRVDVNFYPPSSDRSSGWWQAHTDGARLMANALVFAAGGAVDPCYADCDGNETLNIDDFLCFINEFSQAQMMPIAQQITHYANCTGSTDIPVLTIDDFLCFINEFSQGCP